MKNVFFEGPVLWSQIDANMHLRHSAYADFAAQARLGLLDFVGLSMETLVPLQLGPILFREELHYLREIVVNERVSVTAELTKARRDGSRWSFRQEIYKQDGTKAAVIVVDGAWIDTGKRKLGKLPDELTATFFDKIPRSDDFIMESPKISTSNMSQSDLFLLAQEDSKKLAERPDNETLLKLYALFKQGSTGDAPLEGPSNPFDIVGKAKYEAWSTLRGTPSEDAQQKYIALVEQLKQTN
jgi:acyl-CoA thioester hydrolase